MLIIGIIAIIVGVILNSMGIALGELAFFGGIILIVVWFFKGHGSKIFNKLLSGQDLNSALRESAVEKIATHVGEDSNPLISNMLKAQKRFFWRCQICGEEATSMGATQVTSMVSSRTRCYGGGSLDGVYARILDGTYIPQIVGDNVVKLFDDEIRQVI